MKKGQDILIAFFKTILLVGGVAYVFYDSIFGLIPGVVAGMYIYRTELRNVREKRRRRIMEHFKDLITAMQSALEAGNSIERSFLLAGQELSDMYGHSNEMARQIRVVGKRLELNITLEDALHRFAEHFAIREMFDFIEVISTIKNTGGNAIQIMRDTVGRIVEGIELNAELEVTVAAKKLEQQIMTFMPAVIIVFLRVTSRGFLDPLYGNIVGILIMTVVLGINVFADYLGKKIVEINI